MAPENDSPTAPPANALGRVPGNRAQSQAFRWISIGAAFWALLGIVIAYKTSDNVNHDAKGWVGFVSTVLSLCAIGAALLIKRGRYLGIAGALLFLSIGTPTYAAWAVNVIPIILIIALVMTVRRDRQWRG
jgi:hypothetical protein